MAKISPVVLILGSGPNIGQSVGRAFAAKGYRVALASRKANKAQDTTDQIHIQSDFADSSSISTTFSKVKASLGIPSVVVYNAGAVTPNPPDDPLSLALADFNKDFTINTVSPFVAAQQAAIGFAQLPDSASKTFIYTGNATNTITIPPLLDLGVGKSATAHIIQSAAAAYKDRGFKFYYGDERKADGAPAYGDIDGDAHAKMYVELAEGKTQGPWQQTFVKGVGYKHFPTKERL
ncbi:MAG: hypothetical protein M1822_007717 [Bathelium mastoideum]|nr:MAG: hypothetical protein M1822_007717 [Bathelium mastoideum]